VLLTERFVYKLLQTHRDEQLQKTNAKLFCNINPEQISILIPSGTKKCGILPLCIAFCNIPIEQSEQYCQY
jgi:hypothetical protein